MQDHVSRPASENLVALQKFGVGQPVRRKEDDTLVRGKGKYTDDCTLPGQTYAWIVRSTPGALVAFAVVVLVLPVLFGDALGNWGKHVAEFLPSSAGSAFAQSIPDGLSLSPWWGLAVLAAWVLAGLATAVVLLRRRDA